MSDDLSIVLVSNRGPVSFVRVDDRFDIKRGAGGLAGAMHPVARRVEGRASWIAAATSQTDRDALRAGAADGLEQQLGYPVYLLDISPETYTGYYDLVSNRMLWFANHCLWDELGIQSFADDELRAWDEAYRVVNRRFADAVVEVVGADGLVLFQDYHLTLAPAYLRARRPHQVIFHFTHSSFCADGLRFLPEHIGRGVVEGMLGADLLGFHTRRWAEEFFRAAEHCGAKVDRDDGSVSTDGRRTWVRVYPIPIDARSLRERAGLERAQSWAEAFASRSQPLLLVRADRTEPSKNIVRGFEAFGELLDARTDLRGRVRFVACLYPSRQSLSEYRKYSEAIRDAAAEVNERHGDCVELYMQDDFDRTLGALSVYDVLLVNSIMDGMNLVSKEGPTVNRRDGVVVLSPTAGSFDELADHVVPIGDPTDVAATVRALEAAFELQAGERERRAASLRAIVEQRRPEDWINAQLDDLVSIQDQGVPHSAFA